MPTASSVNSPRSNSLRDTRLDRHAASPCGRDAGSILSIPNKQDGLSTSFLPQTQGRKPSVQTGMSRSVPRPPSRRNTVSPPRSGIDRHPFRTLSRARSIRCRIRRSNGFGTIRYPASRSRRVSRSPAQQRCPTVLSSIEEYRAEIKQPISFLSSWQSIYVMHGVNLAYSIKKC